MDFYSASSHPPAHFQHLLIVNFIRLSFEVKLCWIDFPERIVNSPSIQTVAAEYISAQ